MKFKNKSYKYLVSLYKVVLRINTHNKDVAFVYKKLYLQRLSGIKVNKINKACCLNK